MSCISFHWDSRPSSSIIPIAPLPFLTYFYTYTHTSFLFTASLHGPSRLVSSRLDSLRLTRVCILSLLNAWDLPTLPKYISSGGFEK